ncbi:MAG: hypothetical protein PVG98_10885 [Chromatiales bacterium]|jgi:hypothetical protein
MKMIPVAFERPILPGSFEYSLSWLINHEPDPRTFEAHCPNDDGGRAGSVQTQTTAPLMGNPARRA